MSTTRIARALSVVAALLAMGGCGNQLQVSTALNHPPEVHFDPVTAPIQVGEDVVHRVSWTGSDLDGGSLTYLVAINPRSLEVTGGPWQTTADHTYALRLRRATPLAAGMRLDPGAGGAGDYEVIAVRAKDRVGSVSEPIVRAFLDGNVAPIVQITSPRPSSLITIVVPPTLRIDWDGIDPDGVFTGRPVKYKWTLLPEHDPLYALALADPDSLRRLVAPAFAGWDSTSSDTTFVRFENLTIGARYLFVVTAFDEQGAYDPIFSLNKNMLRFRVGAPGSTGPRLTLFNDYFNYTYPSGGFSTDPTREIPLEAPGTIPFTIHWFGEPSAGLDIRRYRWSLDIADLFDETPRTNKNDLEHWSDWSLATTTATFRFKDHGLPTIHRFYVEVEDEVGFVSLGIVRIQTLARPAFDRELLIVDDTRLRGDAFAGGVPRPPMGPWPTAAELDTFLFARGGVPWIGYPAGTLSSPGIFDGYDFDTLGTRTGQLDLTVPLDVLSRYRQVVWIVDALSATYSRNGRDAREPMTALRYMTVPTGRQNMLATYLEQGGKLWLLGGGAGYAATIDRNRPFNDELAVTFSAFERELVPGAFMHDEVHWRSEFRGMTVPGPLVEKSPFPIGEYQGGPDYGRIPPVLAAKTPASDPVPPLRTPPAFYPAVITLEHLTLANPIVEDRVPSGPVTKLVSTLDTIYVARGPGLPAPGVNPEVDRIVNPVMTSYHGDENGSVVFSGFDLWSWRRSHCVALVDAVLQDVWGLPKSGAAAPAIDAPDAGEEPRAAAAPHRR